MAIQFKNCIEFARTKEDVLRVVDHAIRTGSKEGLEISERCSDPDILDLRVRVMRVYAPLHDLEMWEPATLTEHQKKQLVVLREIVANCDNRRAKLRT